MSQSRPKTPLNELSRPLAMFRRKAAIKETGKGKNNEREMGKRGEGTCCNRSRGIDAPGACLAGTAFFQSPCTAVSDTYCEILSNKSFDQLYQDFDGPPEWRENTDTGRCGHLFSQSLLSDALVLIIGLWRGVVVKQLCSVNEVTLRRARLLAGCVTGSGQVNRKQSRYVTSHPSQPGHPSVNRLSEYKQKLGH